VESIRVGLSKVSKRERKKKLWWDSTLLSKTSPHAELLIPCPVPSSNIPSNGHLMIRIAVVHSSAVVNSPKRQGSLLAGSNQRMEHAL
jgi:hypothetical protein